MFEENKSIKSMEDALKELGIEIIDPTEESEEIKFIPRKSWIK